MTQPQELEQAIRQKNLYLQAQDNQIRRNQQLLKKQKAQLSQTKAQLTQQTTQLKLVSSTQLKVSKAIVDTATKKARLAVKKIKDSSQAELDKLKTSSSSLKESLALGEDQLAKIDEEIIEADTLHREVLNQIKAAKLRLAESRRQASFQAVVVADLQRDAEALINRVDSLNRTQTGLKGERANLDIEVAKAKQSLISIETSILTKRDVEAKLLQKVELTKKSLDKLLKQEKDLRADLATKSLKVEEDKASIKIQQADMKRLQTADQQLKPRAFRSAEDSKGFFKV